MKSVFSRKTDSVDIAAGLAVLSAAVFVSTFFWNAAAGARGSEESYMARLRRASEKRIGRERAQVKFLLDLEQEGETGLALQEGERASQGLSGNSQFHLFMARAYRAEGRPAPALSHYRRALEANRDYSDRRSPYYLGTSLRPYVRETKPRLAGSAAADAAVRQDLFYIERSLAGGCH